MLQHLLIVSVIIDQNLKISTPLAGIFCKHHADINYGNKHCE